LDECRWSNCKLRGPVRSFDPFLFQQHQLASTANARDEEALFGLRI
jgi:hypothetical protein